MIPEFRRKLIFLICFTFLSFPLLSQNLVPNSGFEQFTGCPTGSGEISLAAPWTSAGAPADLFSSCHVNSIPAGCSNVGVPFNFAGNSAAASGSNYSGFYTKSPNANQRNYIKAPLNSPLNPGQLYKVSAAFRRSQNSGIATNRIGICLSTSALSQTGNGVISIPPQFELNNVLSDTSSWFTFNGFYIASGGEAHITLGNFRNDAATTSFNFSIPVPACPTMAASAFYYTDNISITPLTEQLSVTGDTLICTGDSTTLTGVTNTEGWWSLASAPNDTLPSSNNSISVFPNTATTYIWNGITSDLSVTVSVVPPPSVNLPNDSTICEGTSLVLNAGIPGGTYVWSTGSGSPSITIAESGEYVVTVSNGSCAVSDTFNLSVIPAPDILLPASAIICPDNSEFVVLNAGSGLSFLWTPSGDTIPSITVTSPGAYNVTVTHPGGCTRSADVIITESCRETIFVPAGFTPNNDGVNDIFCAEGTGIVNLKLRVFSRWGQLVFESDRLGTEGGWNGFFLDEPAPEGTYAYKIQYDVIQSNGKKKRFNKVGSFSLIR